MRIALDATYSIDPHPSGIAVYSRELMRELASQHPRDTFLRCYRPKQWRQAPKAEATNVRNRLLLPPLSTFSGDVYHALNQRVDRRPAKRVLTTFHDLFVMTGDYSSPEFRKRFSAQARDAAQRSDLIVAVSNFTAEQVVQQLGFERSRIRVVPHGIKKPASKPEVQRENIILSVGALQKRKNVGRLVSAMDQMPSDWRLILAGSPTGYLAGDILQQIAGSKSKDRITITGYIPDQELERLFWRASIFAFPSLDEGFGMPILEAMVHGVPVLTSSGSALVEVAGGAALVADPGSTEEISAGLKRLINDPDLRDELVARGMAHAAQFSWERTARETWEAYTALVNYF